MFTVLLAALALSLAGSLVAAPLGRTRGVVIAGRLAQGLLFGVLGAGLVARLFEAQGIVAYAWPLALVVIALAALGAWRLARATGAGDVPGASAVAIAAHRAPITDAIAAHGAPITDAMRGASWRTWGPFATIVGTLALLAAFEAHDRPPFPWDAWTTWVFRAKGAFLAPGVAFAQSPGAADPFALEVHAAQYPNLIGSVLAWLARLAGEWREAHLMLLWPAAYAACAVALFSLADTLLARRGTAVVVALLFATTPFLVTHAMLAGYMDLWSTLSVIALAGAVLRAVRGDPVDVALVVAFAAPLLIKLEGVVWVAIALLVVGFVRRPKVAGVVLALAAVFVVFCVLMPGGLAIGDAFLLSRDHVRLPYLGETPLGANPVIVPVTVAFLGTETFGVTSWAVVAGVVLLPFVRREAAIDVGERALRLFGGGGAVFVLGIFGLTIAGLWAEDQTAVSRVLLQLLPVWLLVAAPSISAVRSS